MTRVDCSECGGTGNFYGNDEDGDFLPCDVCKGTSYAEGKHTQARVTFQRDKEVDL